MVAAAPLPLGGGVGGGASPRTPRPWRRPALSLTGRGFVALAALVLAPAAAAAQTIPTVDTEDASLGSLAVGDRSGRFHLVAGVDLRNGDYARGNYDDDAAGLDRVPVHLQLGFAWDLSRDAGGKTDLWLVASSSNGFHAPSPAERTRPRSWYESNNLLALVARPAEALTVGAAYTIKTSPNGVAGTSHEASVTAAMDGEHGLAALHPAAAATVRPKGGGGAYTQVAIAPEVALGDAAATLSFPALVGVGWGGFYAAGSGDRVHASAGIGVTRLFALGGARWRFHAEALAIVRDARLRRLGGEGADTGAVVPLATVGLTLAY